MERVSGCRSEEKEKEYFFFADMVAKEGCRARGLVVSVSVLVGKLLVTMLAVMLFVFILVLLCEVALIILFVFEFAFVLLFLVAFVFMLLLGVVGCGSCARGWGKDNA